MSITNFSDNGNGFLSFANKKPRIYVTSSSPHPPERTLQYWQEDGFDVQYLPYSSAQKESYTHTLKTLADSLDLTERFALVCYGEAASVVLKVAQKPMNKCCAIVAYYPTVLPSPKTMYPSLLQVVVHVAALGQKCPPPELCAWRCYRYERGLGFADPTAKNYSASDAYLAGSRSLACLRKGFKKDVDIETVVDEAWRAKYNIEDAQQGSLAVAMRFTQNSPHVTLLPTLEGGLGRRKLQEFYQEFFIPSLVDDFNMRLVSRTVGVDRVVDEMVVSFTHTDEIDWILPGVPPTDKHVEIAVVSIVAVRGGKLVSEHMYWDQASVLMQIGLLDPKAVPRKLKNDGLKRLPVVGAEAAKQLVEPQQQKYNSLLKEHGLMDGLDGVNGVNGS